jgi:hypothetical protein
MLDPVINKHQDTLADIQAAVSEDIDTILASIDIDAVIDDPQGAMQEVVEVVKEKILSEHLEPAVKAGIEFAKEIQKAKAIKVDNSNDPQVNDDKVGS